MNETYNFDAALQRAKLAALKELAYGASHEINNPLANIATRAQALLIDEQQPERRKMLATIVAQAMRAHEMIADLMLFAKPPPLTLTSVALAPLIEQVIAECRADAAEQATELVFSTAGEDACPTLISADATHLAVAIKALVRNALEALGSAGRVEIAMHCDDNQTVIAVSDNGPGIAEQVRAHLFDPFYSGREAGRGLGFGLCKCWRIAELHGGRIEVESVVGAGSTFRLILPSQSS